MPTDRPAERKSVHDLVFEHYLRTGERLTEREWLGRQERKFNPYHDELGKFTSPPGVTVSYGNHLARMTEPPKVGANRANPASGVRIPAGGQIFVEAGEQAARVTSLIAAAARAVNRIPPVRPAVKALLTQITNGEGTGDAAAIAKGVTSGYDVASGYG